MPRNKANTPGVYLTAVKTNDTSECFGTREILKCPHASSGSKSSVVYLMENDSGAEDEEVLTAEWEKLVLWFWIDSLLSEWPMEGAKKSCRMKSRSSYLCGKSEETNKELVRYAPNEKGFSRTDFLNSLLILLSWWERKNKKASILCITWVQNYEKKIYVDIKILRVLSFRDWILYSYENQ